MSAALQALAGLAVLGSGECAATPQAAPQMLERAIAERGGAPLDEMLRIERLGDDAVLVLTSDQEAEPLGVNGAASRFDWTQIDGGAGLVLTACNLGDAALGLSAGATFVEWAGPKFFSVRPEPLADMPDVSTHAFESAALGAVREIYIFAPAEWSGARGDPLIISGDGLAATDFAAIAATLASQGRTRPAAFLSARFGESWLGDAQTDLRSAEYLAPGESAHPSRVDAYLAHESFFFDELLPFAREALGGETGPVIAFGMSASATFALEQGLRRPGEIDAVIAASPPITNMTRTLAAARGETPTVHLWCGEFETLFCDPLTELGEAAGLDVQTRRASHTTALWEEAFAASLLELAPPGP